MTAGTGTCGRRRGCPRSTAGRGRRSNATKTFSPSAPSSRVPRAVPVGRPAITAGRRSGRRRGWPRRRRAARGVNPSPAATRRRRCARDRDARRTGRGRARQPQRQLRGELGAGGAIRWKMIPPSDSLKATKVVLPSEPSRRPRTTEPGIWRASCLAERGMRRSAEAVAAAPRREQRAAATARAMRWGGETSVSWVRGLGSAPICPPLLAATLPDLAASLSLQMTGASRMAVDPSAVR